MWHKSALLLISSMMFSINPVEEWQKPFPHQQLITRSTPEPVVASQPTSFHYEDIIAFSLTATIAAFHVDPSTFLEDQKRLSKYFEPHALNQIEQSLYAATGSGFLDHCIIAQTTCDAITRSPIIIEKKAPHFIQVRLPMITHDEKHIDVILSIKIANTLRVSDFSIETAL